MNDPIIHAKASKIVEAIMKATYPPQKLNPNYKNNYEVEQMRYRLKEALASLGGEEKAEWRVFETSTALGDTGDYMHSTGITNGENTLIFEDETDEDGVLINIVKKLNSHQSEREVLEGFMQYWEDKAPSRLFLLYGPIKQDIDRYLAEKHKTE